jgi:hypothetical protein
MTGGLFYHGSLTPVGYPSFQRSRHKDKLITTMPYVLRANGKDYEVTAHAARRMVQRAIPEAMVIETVEQGTVTEQPHGTDLYEHQIYDTTLDEMVIVRVVVDEENRRIISVIDDTGRS